MRIIALLALLICCASLVGGCAGGNSASNLTQAQLNAIETREVDAGMEETYAAASGALFDAGYTIAMSDRQAGLMTGKKGKDNTNARMWVSPYIRDSEFCLSIQLRPISPSQTAARVKTSVNGEPVVKKEAIDAFWTLMQRQVMMKAPPPETPAALPSSTPAAAR